MQARRSARASGRSSLRRGHPRFRVAAVATAAVIGLAAVGIANAAPGPRLYPDLRTRPPGDLRFDTVQIEGVPRPVLRFSNTVWNAGRGPLYLVAKTDKQAKKSQVSQRIYSTSSGTGQYDQRHVGDF